MKNIKFNPFKYLFLIFLFLTLSACSGGLNAGLEAYQSPDGRYAFLYPTGWTRVKVDGGPEIIYHDLINSLSKAYVNMSRTLYVGENLPRDYLDNIEELYSLFVLSFLFKYELEYIWENRIQINLMFRLMGKNEVL